MQCFLIALVVTSAYSIRTELVGRVELGMSPEAHFHDLTREKFARNNMESDLNQSSGAYEPKMGLTETQLARVKGLHDAKELLFRGISKDACLGNGGMEWMRRMWTKKPAGSKCNERTQICNPLEKSLGDAEDLAKKGEVREPITPEDKSGMHQLMTYRSPNEPPPWIRFTLYRSGEEKVVGTKKNGWDAEHFLLLWGLDMKETIVIGNGGFGKSGGVEYLASKYNAYLKKRGKPTVNVIWRAGDSNHNFLAINKIDLAITYEPVLEKRLIDNGLASEVVPLFVNYFALAIPCRTLDTCDRFDIKGFIFLNKEGERPSPVVVLMYIIFMGFKSILDGGPVRTYASRFNFSAMGLRDHFIMTLAAKRLAELLCSGQPANVWEQRILILSASESSSGRLADGIMGIIRRTSLSRELEWCSADMGNEIYYSWNHNAVDHHRKAFPWEIREFANEKDQYHMNDMSFLPPENFTDITDSGGCDVGHGKGCWYQVEEDLRADYAENPYANPGDLILPTRSSKKGSAAQKFFAWAKKHRTDPDFWDGFKGAGLAVGKNIAKFTDFTNVLDSQAKLQVGGQSPDAEHCRANLYFWGSVNWANDHTSQVTLMGVGSTYLNKRFDSEVEYISCVDCNFETLLRALAGLTEVGDESCHHLTDARHDRTLMTFSDREDLVEDHLSEVDQSISKAELAVKVLCANLEKNPKIKVKNPDSGQTPYFPAVECVFE